mgnify:CR=1 FL=1
MLDEDSEMLGSIAMKSLIQIESCLDGLKQNMGEGSLEAVAAVDRLLLWVDQKVEKLQSLLDQPRLN